jgi:hypothetical protein
MARAKTPRSAENTSLKTNGGPNKALAESQFSAEAKTNVVPINLEDEIRRRAYELYEQRGYISGHDHDDWLTAEREVLGRYNRQSA